MSPNAKMLMLMGGSTMQGMGATLQKLDPDTKGSDDLGGTILRAGGSVMVAAASDNLHSERQAITLLRDTTQEWLDENPEA